MLYKQTISNWQALPRFLIAQIQTLYSKFMTLIELKNIYKTYFLREVSVPVLKGISLTVNNGEFIALMGASGSGKSTLMNILGCLDRLTSGEYYFEGNEISSVSNDNRALIRNKKIGFVFQNFNLLPRTSALDNIIMPLSYTAENLSLKDTRKKGMELLSLFALENRSNHESSQLSGGQQQRVAIARALVNNPSILLADEPTGNLDSKTGEEVLEIFTKLNKEKGITIVLVTHDNKVAAHAKRIIHITDGIIAS